MNQRLKFAETAPEAYATVLGLEKYNRRSVDPIVYELVKIRASILNGCSLCVDMHTHEAMEAGETPQRLFGLGAWHDAPFYTEKERAALALTEAVTKLGDHGVPDDVWDQAAAVWDEKEIADLLTAIATINVWNRLMISTQTPPPLR
ncbi:carboxymuconolactone decarboxylase family protein [Solicola gregarius]|uniref:Carboxymuconolactone decarboxylase family protein n=1 Tax=Solicola gregarius TaxID=2908642 RepID=A0AA46TKE0_9ACTN|nr:carboxymuconolactone decarboxylase family protein [Solicola gregarius]UYM06738.1 carboxymuconolactone decarboxylase family protein [Solicola gregarius]